MRCHCFFPSSHKRTLQSVSAHISLPHNKMNWITLIRSRLLFCAGPPMLLMFLFNTVAADSALSTACALCTQKESLVANLIPRLFKRGWTIPQICATCLGIECGLETTEKCEFGFSRNHCGFQVCSKGPGETCGGPGNLWGKCGKGLHCECDRCVGCSAVTLDCEDRTSNC